MNLQEYRVMVAKADLDMCFKGHAQDRKSLACGLDRNSSLLILMGLNESEETKRNLVLRYRLNE